LEDDAVLEPKPWCCVEAYSRSVVSPVVRELVRLVDELLLPPPPPLPVVVVVVVVEQRLWHPPPPLAKAADGRSSKPRTTKINRNDKIALFKPYHLLPRIEWNSQGRAADWTRSFAPARASGTSPIALTHSGPVNPQRMKNEGTFSRRLAAAGLNV